jgi:endonuclease-8
MRGSWHRYSPGERWLRSPSRARLILEVPGAVAVCFDAPTVELYEIRAEPAHPVLSTLGPDLLAEDFDETAVAEATRRLRDPGRASLTIAEALLDQRTLAGVGNIYKNEVLFVERVDPFARVADIDDGTLRRLIVSARRLLLAGSERGVRDTTDSGSAGRRVTDRLWVYRRAARPCRRCGAIILTRTHGLMNRRTFWCPRCQPAAVEEPR